MSKSDYKRTKISFQFAAVPIDVLRSQEWIDLPPNAVKLAMALMSQYTGANNGKLCPGIEAVQRLGFRSRTTLANAKEALLACPFVFVTRKGRPPDTPEWVGFTWWKLNWEKAMDIDPREFPYLNFIKLGIKDPNTGRGPPPKIISLVQKQDTYPQKRASTCPETGHIGVANQAA